jgi:threonine aldolase
MLDSKWSARLSYQDHNYRFGQKLKRNLRRFRRALAQATGAAVLEPLRRHFAPANLAGKAESKMNFASDNCVGIDPEILAAIAAANAGPAPSYGGDAWTLKAQARLDEIFERKCASFLVTTGTAANALALAALTPAYGGVFCHGTAHVMEDECGAPEFFTAGAKLIGIDGEAGKITPEALKAKLAGFPRGSVNHIQPATLSLSQTTECGTLYLPREISALAEIAHEAGLAVHMDGARFANAVAALQCTPAETSWKAGVDVLSFGATKNGALACEAVVFFDPRKAEDFAYRRKRGGHALSKSRFLGAQMIAYLDNDRWLALAQRANAQAAKLASGLAEIPHVELIWPCAANEVFAEIPRRTDEALKAAGARYYEWGSPDRRARSRDTLFVRLVTSFATETVDIEKFLALARATAAP